MYTNVCGLGHWLCCNLSCINAYMYTCTHTHTHTHTHISDDLLLWVVETPSCMKPIVTWHLLFLAGTCAHVHIYMYMYHEFVHIDTCIHTVHVLVYTACVNPSCCICQQTPLKFPFLLVISPLVTTIDTPLSQFCERKPPKWGGEGISMVL